MESGVVDFYQHEGSIRIETLSHGRRRPQIVNAQFAGTAENEIVDAVLRLNSLIHVLVAREHQGDAVLFKDRLEARTEVLVRSVEFAIRIQGMVKEADFPGLVSAFELALDPSQLIGVHVSAIECEETRFDLLEAVIALAVHIERLVEALVGIIVIAQRSVKLYTGIEQGFVGVFEFQLEVLGSLPAV